VDLGGGTGTSTAPEPAASPNAAPTVASPNTVPVNAQGPLPSFFGGLPAWVAVLGLAIAGLAGLGLKRLAAGLGLLPGGAGCELGAPSGVPTIREA
jgi:hypothetical protein